MITRNLLTALAAGVFAIASQASFAQTPFGLLKATPTGHVEHAYQGGPKTVVPHGIVNRAKHGSELYGPLAGARAESSEFVPAASANQHRYYGGPKYH